MEDSIDEGGRRDAIGDRVAEFAVRRMARANLDGQTRTVVEPKAAPFDVRRVDDPLGVVLTLEGELDLTTVPRLREQLDHVMGETGTVVIDLSGLRFIDSSGLHLLMRAEKQLRSSGGRLVLVYGSRAVRRVFELTRLDGYFAWSDSSSAALGTVVDDGLGEVMRS